MTDKKNDKKVNEVLQEKDLDKVTGGAFIGSKTDAEVLSKPEDRKGTLNQRGRFPW